MERSNSLIFEGGLKENKKQDSIFFPKPEIGALLTLEVKPQHWCRQTTSFLGGVIVISKKNNSINHHLIWSVKSKAYSPYWPRPVSTGVRIQSNEESLGGSSWTAQSVDDRKLTSSCFFFYSNFYSFIHEEACRSVLCLCTSPSTVKHKWMCFIIQMNEGTQSDVQIVPLPPFPSLAPFHLTL